MTTTTVTKQRKKGTCKTCKRQPPICGGCNRIIREEFPYSYCDTCEVKWEVKQVYD